MALTPPAGATGRGAAAIGRDPGRGRSGRGSAAVPVGAAGAGRVGTTVVLGVGGANDGAVSSTRSPILDGTIRPVGVTAFDAAGFAGAGGAVGASGVGGAASATATAGAGAVGSTLAGVGARFGAGVATGSVVCGCRGAVGVADGSSSFKDRGRSRGTPVGGGGGGGGAAATGSAGASTGAGSTTSAASSGSASGTTLGALTSRGGPNLGRIAGSEALALFLPFPDDAAFCANRGPVGRLTSRSRANRSANCRATISSMVLEALFTSMPCSRLRRSMTSWLGMPSTSATL